MYGGAWSLLVGRELVIRQANFHSGGIHYSTPTHVLTDENTSVVEVKIGQKVTLVDVQDDRYDTHCPTGYERIGLVVRDSEGHEFALDASYVEKPEDYWDVLRESVNT